MKKQKMKDNFIAHRYAMVKSPAYGALSPYAHSILARLEREYVRCGGRENGDLICTYRQFKDWCGASTRAIRGGLAELEAFGFIKIKRGRPGLRNYGKAARYGLTYLPKTGSDIRPSDEWAKITTTEQAQGIKARLKNPIKRAGPNQNAVRRDTLAKCAPLDTLSPDTTTTDWR